MIYKQTAGVPPFIYNNLKRQKYEKVRELRESSAGFI